LKKLYTRATESQQQREILFWMADAVRGEAKFEEAAELYFRSASFNNDGNDVWGQSSRYRAAEALAEAGLIQDARRVYESLLELTTDSKRRVILERALQQLWLKDHGVSARDG
jgi:tetratricopeptide (TPR) repeat protein